jgi:hypothetical protein
VNRWNATADAERLAEVLADVTYPAEKWQLIMHAEEHRADAATRATLWALPAGSFADLAAVLAGIGSGRTPAERLARYRAARPRGGPSRPHFTGRLRPLP